MTKISIDKDKCINCGLCVKDCLTYSIEQDENGNVNIAKNADETCFKCQHCFAICPTGAIKFENNTAEQAEKIEHIEPEKILHLIKSRRSVRQYKPDDISDELMTKIKTMLPYIPTGCNYNGLHFSIIETRSAMDEIRNFVNKRILKLISNKYTSRYAGKFVKFKEAFEAGEDIIFREAPHMIVVSSDIHAPCANVDPIIALSYIELYAHSLGLGTCWCGFAQACFKLIPTLSKMVQIPDGYKPVYVMLLGYPDVKYQRLTIPEEFPITEIKNIDSSEMNWLEKARRILLNFIR